MSDAEIFLSARPAFPWSEYPLGPVALAVVAGVLVGLTLWTYLGHRQATPRRLFTVLGLRLLALLVALVTAVRPRVGVQEDPKLPSVLVLGIDLSESMSVRDEVNTQARIAAVRRVLEKCDPILEQLKAEQNVTVQTYGFGAADFSEATGNYNPTAPADGKRSDYGTYLTRTLDRWRGTGTIRGHIVIGDGADNGSGPPALAAAERWKASNGPVHTCVVGTTNSPSDARDVAITDATADPSPVPVKTDFVLTVRVNAFGFPRAKVPVRVQLDAGDGYKDAAGDTAVLTKEKDNEIKIPMKAPDRPGEYKLRVEIPIDSVPGDAAPANNELETYLTVTKEGVRVLLVGRLTQERIAAGRVLLPPRGADKAAGQFALIEVARQDDGPPTPGERTALDFDQQQYDVMIVGNISAKHLLAIDPGLAEKIAEQVTKKGMGLLFAGGHATFLGTREYPDATGWRDVAAIRNVLPVDLNDPGPYPESVFARTGKRYQYVPTAQQAGDYLNRLAPGPLSASLDKWARLNAPDNRARFTGLSRMGRPKPTATVFAVASDEARTPHQLPAKPEEAETMPPLLVGHQIGAGSRGRVLALAAQDTFMWQSLGLRDKPPTAEGIELHAHFWRGLVKWLAHQEEDEGAAFARPARRRVPVRGDQVIEIGLRGPGGAPAVDPTFEVRVVAPGENPATARLRQHFPAGDGKFTVPFVPPAPGEYTVTVKATGQAADGSAVAGEATARFLAYPETSDEMLRTAADPDFMKSLATAGGGTAHRLEDLPGFLREMASRPPDVAKPKPRYLPDWRRNHSGGFLPAWLATFAMLLATEWGLRRLWGMV